MTRKTDDLSLTREQTDPRIRRTARVASALCWVAAVVTAALAAASLVAACLLTAASARASDTDLLTAFLTTSEASGDFVIAETEPQDPVYEYDDEGNVVGMVQTGGGQWAIGGNPLQLAMRGVVANGLACAAFALAALVCARVRRTGEVFSPARTRELGAVGGLLLLSGLVPPVAMLAAFPFVTSLVGEMAMSYSLVQPLATGDFICCAAGLLLMAVARMFEYGCILQRQDDETL